ncbi:MAG: PilN domain-containing protein [Dehalococcoidia bacterium]
MTMQQAPERRPAKINLNLLPDEYRPPKKSYLGLTLYLIAFILICAAAMFFIMKSGIDSDIKALDQNLTSLQQQIAELRENKDEAEPIQDQITNTQNQLASLEADYQSFLDSRAFWSEIIAEIDDLVPGKKITLDSITDRGDTINIAGMSTKRIYVYDYAVSLEESDLFENVDFTFGDCPDVSECDFNIILQLTGAN